MNAGKWLIFGILTVALAAGVAAWMQRYSRTDAVQAFWGEQTLDLMANAPEVDTLRWTDNPTAERRRATVAKGMLNVRYMLGSDFAYQWPAGDLVEAPARAWGLDFHRGAESLQIEFNADCGYAWVKSGKGIRLVPQAAENLRSFFEERFENQAGGAGESGQTAQ
jgi:hypothetical protein